MNGETLDKFLKGTEILSITKDEGSLYVFCGNGSTLVIHARGDTIKADILPPSPSEREILRDMWDAEVEDSQ